MAENSIYNRIIQSEHIPGAFEDWTDYRNQLTDYILEQCRRVKQRPSEKIVGQSPAKEHGPFMEESPVMAIWGAGYSNDIDLKCLSEHFRLVLIDRDKAALEEAIKKYGLSKSAVTCVDLPFWHIDEELYYMCEAMLADGSDADCIIEYLENAAGYNSFDLPKDYADSFDYSVCIGLHSQLNIRLAALLYCYKNNFDEEDISKIDIAIRALNRIAVERLNDLLYIMTSGRIIWGYELTSNAEDIKDRGPSQIAGALELEQDIHLHKGCDIEILSEKELLWDFSNSSQGTKSYIMKIITAAKI